jgi:hypothetical protein
MLELREKSAKAMRCVAVQELQFWLNLMRKKMSDKFVIVALAFGLSMLI